MNSTLVEEKINKAWQFLLEHNYSKALSIYERLAQQNSENAWIWLQYGAAAGAVYLTSGGSGSLTNSGPVPDGSGQCIDDTNALWLECTNEGGGNLGVEPP